MGYGINTGIHIGSIESVLESIFHRQIWNMNCIFPSMEFNIELIQFQIHSIYMESRSTTLYGNKFFKKSLSLYIHIYLRR